MGPAKMVRSAIALALASAVAFVPGTATAQVSASTLHAGTLAVPLNKSQVLSTDRPIAKAMVGNSEIADILPLTDRSVYVLGKAMGTTSLTLYDAGGRVLSIMDVAVGPDFEGFNAQVAELIPGESIEGHISGNALILTGLASDPGAADRAVQLARTYAGDNIVNMIGVGSSQQVSLEVKFAEVKRSVGDDLAVSGFLTSQGGRFNGAVGEGASLTAGGLRLGTISEAFGVFTRSFSDVLGLDIDAALDVLESKGFSKTLAEPTLIALSGDKASFLAGGEFPIPVAQSGSGANGGSQAFTVEFKQFGVSLAFTPTVLSDGTINLRVEPEVSAIDPTASVSINGITVPGLQTRRASTTLELRDGESFAIAGLLQDDIQTTVNQLPVLGNIPILGALFRSTSFQKGETELLIVVTPRLVRPIRPDQVVLPTDRIKDPTAAQTILTGEAYDPQPLAQPYSEPGEPAPAGDDYEF